MDSGVDLGGASSGKSTTSSNSTCEALIIKPVANFTIENSWLVQDTIPSFKKQLN